MTASLPAAYFEALYARDADPWSFETSAYEHEKYDRTLAGLARPRYRRALEVGCSIGVLTARLASRCAMLVALDGSARALARARRRCGQRRNVKLAEAMVPADWPLGRFDLILLSEVCYYLDPPAIADLASRIEDSLEVGGEVVLVHWIGETDYPLTGDQAADGLIAATAGFMRGRIRERTERYRLDALVRHRRGGQGPSGRR